VTTFLSIVGITLFVQGILVLSNASQWRRKAIDPVLRRALALAYGLIGSSFVVSAFWRPFLFGAFIAVLFMAIVERRIIRQRKLMSREGGQSSGRIG
jgi:uncharacterized membrane protein HdeD (DUF308 family)